MKRNKANFKKVRLRDLLHFFNGKSIRPGGEGRYPVFGSNGVIGGSEEYQYENAIIIGRVGAYCGSVEMCKSRFWASDNTIVAKVDEEENNLTYVNYLLRILNLNKYAGGAAQPLMTQRLLNQIIAYRPDLPTQSRIASILSTYDDLIENNEKRIKILEEIAQRLYAEWFVKFKFPCHKKVKMVDSGTEYGKIPEGWGVKRLGDLIQPQYGFTTSAIDKTSGVKFLRGMDINKTSYINWSSVPCCEIKADDKNRYTIQKGDIFIIRMADPGKIGICEKQVDAIFASYLMRLKIKSRLTSYFLFYFLISEKYQNFVVGSSSGTTRKSVNSKQVGMINILVPDKKTLEDFESKVSMLRSKITNLLDQSQNLSKIRDLLIPQLVTGKRG
ncbi:hypothetical protein A2276_05135 [candidate division WOR-1 bacterium RIFOXYA12_FULL_43_27]|nr:MAG: hypothetical protein A2276_05135 [candidate division WOR-1 bacterium RIFOXYA12_FULL_43_27]OGC20051.1 MAG: hypothetical protein A2292_03140 [candidate division WOR-1 bacterium RIFOXYB2_FULL_46_45]OGC32213.1 MAG: hypothetical protein A2232_08310 [candidate division WOR-1 bacterium RIFOXYA2_FULL_46_56]